MEAYEIKAGQKFDLFNSDNLLGQELGKFEALEDNNGYLFAIYLPGMSGREKNWLQRATINARKIRDGGHVLALIRFDNSPLLFEMEFDPTLYKDRRAMQLVFDNHMVGFVGIESKNNIIQTVRMANMPKRLKQIWTTSWGLALETPEYSQSYRAWINELHKQSVQSLWSIAEPAGYFGEKY